MHKKQGHKSDSGTTALQLLQASRPSGRPRKASQRQNKLIATSDIHATGLPKPTRIFSRGTGIADFPLRQAAKW